MEPGEGQQPTRSPTVAVGKYRLELGSDEGTFALYQPQPELEQARALQAALSTADDEPLQDAADKFEAALGDAAGVTERSERAIRLFTEIAAGSLDPHAISDEVDAMLALLGRLDREGRHKQALRLARDLAALLALLLRWLELVRSLQLALKTARRLGEPEPEAWALHELGSLHLAAGDAATAAKQLEKAAALKEQAGSAARCASRHNLDAARRDLADADALAQARRRRLFRLGLIGATFVFLATSGAALGIRASTHHHRRLASTTPTATQPPNSTTTNPTTTTTTTTATTPTRSTTTPAPPPPLPPTTATTVSVDTTAPTPTLTAPADGSFIADSMPTFSGTAGNDSGDSTTITVFVSARDGTPAGGSPLTATRNGTAFALIVPASATLTDGTYSAQVEQTDDAGNTGKSPPITFTVDTVKPVLTLSCTSLPNAACRGTATETDQPVTITLTDEGAVNGPQTTVSTKTLPANVKGNSFSISLPGTNNGERYAVVASQTDAAGNVGTSETVQLLTATPK
jgi:hypothetical protein